MHRWRSVALHLSTHLLFQSGLHLQVPQTRANPTSSPPSVARAASQSNAGAQAKSNTLAKPQQTPQQPAPVMQSAMASSSSVSGNGQPVMQSTIMTSNTENGKTQTTVVQNGQMSQSNTPIMPMMQPMQPMPWYGPAPYGSNPNKRILLGAESTKSAKQW